MLGHSYRVPTWETDPDGSRYLRSVKIMPGINPRLTDLVLFLYPTRDDADRGTAYGGSGFLIGVPYGYSPEDIHTEINDPDRPRLVHLYAVTVGHCASKTEDRFLRISNRGQTDFVRVPAGGWTYHPDGVDVAVALIGSTEERRGQYYQSITMILREDDSNVGLGNDTYYVGRYTNPYTSDQLDNPTVRFGAISTLPVTIQAKDQRRLAQTVFLVETRSLKGYSGSPVFVNPFRWDWKLTTAHGVMTEMLLGIDIGHLDAWLETEDSDGEKRDVVVNAGLMMVVPAWEIRRLLSEDEDLVKERKRIEDEVSSGHVKTTVRAAGTTLDGQAQEDAPMTRAGFMEALEKVSRPEQPKHE